MPLRRRRAQCDGKSGAGSKPLGIGVAVRLRTLALVVSLVVILGGPETARRGDLRHDVVAFAPQLGDEPLGRRLLGGRGVEYLGTVLVAEVGALPVFLGRVVDFEEQACQRLVGHLCRIEYHTYGFGILVGVACAFIIQDGMTMKGMFKAATDGYVSQTGHPLVDKILSRGGLTSMSFVVFLLLIAMTLGGILEGTGALGVVVDRMTRSVTSPGGLILATLVSCYLMTIGTGNGMLSIIVPARAFEKKFRDMGIQSRVLSRTLEDAVTLGIALVPYSMAAFFIVGVLKIDAMQYIPYAFVNWIVPIFSLTYGFTGFAIWKINKDAGNSPAESEA